MSVLQKVLTKYFPEIEMHDILVLGDDYCKNELYNENDVPLYAIVNKNTGQVLLRLSVPDKDCYAFSTEKFYIYHACKTYKHDQEEWQILEKLKKEIDNIYKTQNPNFVNCANCKYSKTVLVASIGSVVFCCEQGNKDSIVLDSVSPQGKIDCEYVTKELKRMRCKNGEMLLRLISKTKEIEKK